MTNLKKIIEEKDKLFSKKSDEAHQLKQKLIDKTNYMTSDIPHKEKLKEAIQLITLEAMEQITLTKFLQMRNMTT
jgi:hypothetical protein